MVKHLLLTALFGATLLPSTIARNASALPAPEGGPPRIVLAGQSSGDITAAQWAALKSVDLHGCVPDARITALTVCIKDCKGKYATLSSTSGVITKAMRDMIKNLPAGTPFTVKVTVKDGKDKVWEVPDARFVWKS